MGGTQLQLIDFELDEEVKGEELLIDSSAMFIISKKDSLAVSFKNSNETTFGKR
jgi:hypothetical protein